MIVCMWITNDCMYRPCLTSIIRTCKDCVCITMSKSFIHYFFIFDGVTIQCIKFTIRSYLQNCTAGHVRSACNTRFINYRWSSPGIAIIICRCKQNVGYTIYSISISNMYCTAFLVNYYTRICHSVTRLFCKLVFVFVIEIHFDRIKVCSLRGLC